MCDIIAIEVARRWRDENFVRRVGRLEANARWEGRASLVGSVDPVPHLMHDMLTIGLSRRTPGATFGSRSPRAMRLSIWSSAWRIASRLGQGALGHRLARAVWLASFAWLSLLPRTARADDGPRRVGVYVLGTGDKTVRKEIVDLVPDGVEVEQSGFAKSLEAKGFVKNPKFDTSKKLGERVVKALAANKLDLAVVVRVKKRVAHVLVFKKGNPEAELDENVELGKKPGSEAERAALAAPLSRFFRDTRKKEPEPEPEAEAEPEAKPEPAPDAPAEEAEVPAENETARAKPGRPHFLTLALGIGVGARDFEYKDRVSALRPYSAYGIAVSELELELYPFARSEGALANLGVAASLLMALPIKNEVEEATQSAKPKASYRRYGGGLLYRIPFGERAALVVSAAFNAQDFAFSHVGALGSSVPDVRYRSVEPGLEGRIPVGPATLSLGAGYRWVLRGGKLKDRFPNSSVGAVAAHLGVSLPLGHAGWDLRLLTRYERYFYKMHPKTTDRNVAGGALDQYFTALGGVGYAF